MLDPSTSPEPINLSWGQLIAAHWSVCWPAGLAMFLVLALVTSLWEVDELQGQLGFLSVLAQAVYLLVQAAALPRLFKKSFRSFFLATIDSSGATSRSIPAPLLRLVTLRFILAQIALTLLFSILSAFFITGDSMETLRRFTSLLRLANILLIGAAVLHFSLQARHAGSAITAFPQPR
jgi:hypothetical protein